MTIKTRLTIIAILPIALALLIGLSVLMASNRVSREEAEGKIVDEVVRGVFDLNVLTDGYLAYHDQREKSQWESKNKRLTRLIRETSFRSVEEQALLEEVRAYHRQIGTFFTRLVDNYEGPASVERDAVLRHELENRLAGILLVKSRGMFSSASELASLKKSKLVTIRKNADILTILFSVILVVVVGAVSILTSRGLAVAIGRLRKGTEFLSAGNLDYRIEASGNDELAQLARAFNDMTGKLQRSYADLTSTMETLQVENRERRRAEAALQELNNVLETRVLERTVELKAANQELEAFSYTVAHDLRKPLAVVNGYCEAIRELCGDKLDEACKRYLREAYDGTWRMNGLIDALLNFSRLAHVEPRREKVDLSAMAHEVAMELKLAEPGRRVTFQIADGASAEGDAGLLRVALANLVGNAWKYTGTRDEGIIEFGTTEVDGKPAWFVRDNGAGFDMANADKLFAPFQRLPGAEEWRGFGIGLATVERIILRHGGRVWAEGAPGKGATFYFTLSGDKAV